MTLADRIRAVDPSSDVQLEMLAREVETLEVRIGKINLTPKTSPRQ